ncbi:odorant receptor 131-2-like [Chanos chanos]|uniref:Odorant receptor 131-2-like n=1 Tax=Chanos chanos TaxID=29144 RepID=A0A6J2VSB0_CHACN|nr:odorant receptor 131-2-like [Chanos chanos]
MNESIRLDQFYDAFIKNFTSVALGIIINYINGTLVFTFLNHVDFYSDPRYILYIHLVINDMLMLSLAVGTQVAGYISPYFKVSVCCMLLLLISTTTKNTPLNLAGMAIERYIAICKPLHHPQICTVRRTYILIGFIWGISLVPALSDIFIVMIAKPLNIFSRTILCHMSSIYNTMQHTMQATVVQVMYLSFVWVTLIFTYFKVLFVAKGATTDQVSARKARNTILLHAVQLLLCMLSYFTPFINAILLPLFPNSRTNILFVFFLLLNILPRLLSPLIYGIRDKKIFKHIKVYLICRLQCA